MDMSIYVTSGYVWGLAALLLGLLVMPVWRFLATGWVRKRRNVVCGLTKDAIELYFRQFYPNEHVDKNRIREAFENNFDKRFGRHHYTFPGIFLVAVAGLATFMLSAAVAVWLGILPQEAGTIPVVAAAALAGAYMWVLDDLIVRNRRLDLSPANLSWGAFRFVTAVPFGYAFAYIFIQSVAVPVAFLIGSFPTRTLRRVAGRLAARQMNVGELGEEGVSELERLQGINTSNAEAFADEGVTTILQLAYSDPIDLTIRTSLGFSYVVDCVSQALAWIYFEDELKTLRKNSLRGAQEIANFISELDDSKDQKAQARAKAALQQIAQELRKKPESLERTFREIAEDPYTQFLWNAWQ
jgi:hypothetical protein